MFLSLSHIRITELMLLHWFRIPPSKNQSALELWSFTGQKVGPISRPDIGQIQLFMLVNI
jgi:hypothetical protein